MVDVETARQQVASARALVADKRAQAEQAQAQLNQQEQSLPSTTSQEALRQKFKGMQGRIQRQVINREREGIQEAQEYVQSYKDELGRYESDINTTESQINRYESKYAELQKEAREEARAELEAYKQDFEASNPGEKLIVDWSKLRVSGVSSSALSQSLNVDAYNERIDQINKQIEGLSSAPSINKINTQLPRSDRINIPENKIRGGLFSTVSAQEINPNTGRPYGVVSKPEIIKNPKDYIKEKGYIKGTLDYLGSKVSGKIDKYQVKSGNYYQQESIRNAGQILPSVLAYSTPYLGEALLVSGGTETVIRNVPKIKSEPKESLLNIGEGLVESGLGTVGGVSRYSNLRLTREASKLKDAPTTVRGVRFQNTKSGTDVIFGMKQTNPSGFMDRVLNVREQTAFSRVEQPFVNTKKGTLLENGRSYSVILTKTPKGYTYETSAFKQSGRVVKSPGATAVRRTVYNTKVNYVKEPIEANIGLGKVRMRKVVSNTGTIAENRNPLFSDEFYTTTSSSEKFGGKDFEDIFFSGMGKKNPNNKNVLNILSGKVEKIRITGDGMGIPKAIVRPNVKGKIRVFNIRPKAITKRDGYSMFIGGMGKKSNLRLVQKTYSGSTGAEVFAGEVMRKGVTSANLKSSSNSLLSITPRQTQVPKSEYYGKGTYERTESSVAQMPEGRSEFSTIFIDFNNLGQNTRQNTRPRIKQPTKQKNDLMSGFDEAFGLKNPTRGREGLKTPQRINQRTRQSQKQDFGLGQPSAFNWLTGERITPRGTGTFIPSISYKTSGGKVIKQSPGRYLVVVKRYGTDSVIGEATTLEEAKRILTNNLKTYLSASGFVSEKSTGRKQDVSDLWDGMFTSAKRDRYRLVQKRGKRLSSRSEVSEIFGFSRRKGGKSKSLKIKWW